MTEQFFLEKTKWLSLHISARFQTTTFIHACMQAIHIVMHQNCFPNMYSHQPRSNAKVTSKIHKKPHVCKHTTYLCEQLQEKNNAQMLHVLQIITISFSGGEEEGAWLPIQFMFTLFQKINLTQRKTKASFGVPPQADNYRNSEHPMCTGAEARKSWQAWLFVLSSFKNSATCSGSVAADENVS